jgi:hypothetical protein
MIMNTSKTRIANPYQFISNCAHSLNEVAANVNMHRTTSGSCKQSIDRNTVPLVVAVVDDGFYHRRIKLKFR